MTDRPSFLSRIWWCAAPVGLLFTAVPALAQELSCQPNAAGDQWFIQNDSGSSAQEVFTSQDECESTLADTDSRRQFDQELNHPDSNPNADAPNERAPDENTPGGGIGGINPADGGMPSPDPGVPTPGQPPD